MYFESYQNKEQKEQKMASQRFCLRWNNHQTNLLSVFDQLLHAETFTDVTLAVEGQYLKAHKVCYFLNLAVVAPSEHSEHSASLISSKRGYNLFRILSLISNNYFSFKT